MSRGWRGVSRWRKGRGTLLGLLVLAGCTLGPREQGPGATPLPLSPPTGQDARRGGAGRRDALESLGYLTRVPVPEAERARRGVTLYRRDLASPGLNLYGSLERGEAVLMEMDGSLAHVWLSDDEQPGPGERLVDSLYGLHPVARAANGDLLALVDYQAVLRLDARSRTRWKLSLRAHHELALTPSGEVYTLEARPRILERGGRRRFVLDNDVVRVSAAGQVLARLSLLDALTDEPATAPLVWRRLEAGYAGVDRVGLRRLLESRQVEPLVEEPSFPAVRAAMEDAALPPDPPRSFFSLVIAMPGPSPADILHANSLAVLPRDVPGLGRSGDLLVSIRELDLLVVLDPVRRQLEWSWGPSVLQRQHSASVLSNGHVLVFDNRPGRRHSRVVEVDPRARRIVWSYQGDPERPLFSPIMGACQGLPNGNVLITDSMRGHAIEVTREGEVVWEFFNPDLNARGERATLYRMTRLPVGGPGKAVDGSGGGP